MNKWQATNAFLFMACRYIVIAGALVLPVLTGVTIAGKAATWIRWTAFVVSLLVALTAAFQQALRFDTQWRSYGKLHDNMLAKARQLYTKLLEVHPDTPVDFDTFMTDVNSLRFGSATQLRALQVQDLTPFSQPVPPS
jgi:hypothetical protein